MIHGFLIMSRLSAAQIIYTHDFTQKLLNADIRFTAPASGWFNVMAPCQDQYFSYDLCLVSEKDSAELKYIILDGKETHKIKFPQVHFMSKVYHLATNDDGYWLRVSPEPGERILDTLKADWAGEVSFTPKKSITDKKYGKVFSIYKEDIGMGLVVLFYNNEYPGFNRHLKSIAFHPATGN